MIEYPDRTFSPIMSINDAMEMVQDHIKNDIPFRALHVGSVAELNFRRKMPDLEERMNMLEAKFEALEPPPISEVIHIPTTEEVQAFINDNSPCKVRG